MNAKTIAPTNIDNQQPPSSEITTALITKLSDAVTALLSMEQNPNPTIDERKLLEESGKTVAGFLAQTRIRVNLVTGSYEAGLRDIAPIFGDGKEISDTPYKGVILALLARLRKSSKFADRIERDSQQTELDKLVKSFVNKNGTSPSDAISIIRPSEN